MSQEQQVIFWTLFGLCVAQRFFELRISKRNQSELRVKGFTKLEASTAFIAMCTLHVGWFLAMLLEVNLRSWTVSDFVWQGSVLLFGAGQLLRFWAISSLGTHWNVSVMGSSKKETPFVAAGPYQFIRHPNYLAVVIEFATLPLIGGALLTAIIFSILNFVVLYQRIRAEEQQLFAREGYAAVMGKRSRLLPGVW